MRQMHVVSPQNQVNNTGVVAPQKNAIFRSSSQIDGLQQQSLLQFSIPKPNPESNIHYFKPNERLTSMSTLRNKNPSLFCQPQSETNRVDYSFCTSSPMVSPQFITNSHIQQAQLQMNQATMSPQNIQLLPANTQENIINGSFKQQIQQRKLNGYVQEITPSLNRPSFAKIGNDTLNQAIKPIHKSILDENNPKIKQQLYGRSQRSLTDSLQVPGILKQKGSVLKDKNILIQEEDEQGQENVFPSDANQLLDCEDQKSKNANSKSPYNRLRKQKKGDGLGQQIKIHQLTEKNVYKNWKRGGILNSFSSEATVSTIPEEIKKGVIQQLDNILEEINQIIEQNASDQPEELVVKIKYQQCSKPKEPNEIKVDQQFEESKFKYMIPVSHMQEKDSFEQDMHIKSLMLISKQRKLFLLKSSRNQISENYSNDQNV